MPKQQGKDQALLNALGQNLARYIKKRGYQTFEKFAWENSIPKTSLSRLLLGKNDVRISKLYHIAKALNITVDALLKPVKKKPD